MVAPQHRWMITLTVNLANEQGTPWPSDATPGAKAEFHVIGRPEEPPMWTQQAGVGEMVTFEVPQWPTAIVAGADWGESLVARAGIPLTQPEPGEGNWSARVVRPIPTERDDKRPSAHATDVVGPPLSFDGPSVTISMDRMTPVSPKRDSESSERSLELNVTLASIAMGRLNVVARPLAFSDGTLDRLAAARLYVVPEGYLEREASAPAALPTRLAAGLLSDVNPTIDAAGGVASFSGIPHGAYEVAVLTEKGRLAFTDIVRVKPGETTDAVANLPEASWPSLTIRIVESSAQDALGVVGAEVEFNGVAAMFPAFDPGDGLGRVTLDRAFGPSAWTLKRATDASGQIHLPMMPPGELEAVARVGTSVIVRRVAMPLTGDHLETIALDAVKAEVTFTAKNADGSPITEGTVLGVSSDARVDDSLVEVPLSIPPKPTMLSPGEWRFEMKDPLMRLRPVPWFGRLEAGEKRDVVLEYPSEVSVVVAVLDHLNQPVPGMIVYVGERHLGVGTHTMNWGRTEESGEASLVIKAIKGELRAWAMPISNNELVYGAEDLEVTGEHGSSIRFVVRMRERLLHLSGYVHEDTPIAAPVPDAEVMILAADDPFAVSRVRSDANGRWSCDLPVRDYVVRTSADGFETEEWRVFPHRDDKRGYDIDTPMKRGSGTLLLELEASLVPRSNWFAAGRIMRFDESRKEFTTADWNRFDPRGRLVITGLRAGLWAVMIEDFGEGVVYPIRGIDVKDGTVTRHLVTADQAERMTP